MWEQKLKLGGSAGDFRYYSLADCQKNTGLAVNKLPYSLRIMLENVLRSMGRGIAEQKTLEVFEKWLKNGGKYDIDELPYMPSRVLLQDMTGVPVMVDLALVRDELSKRAGKPELANPLVRSDLVADHSVQVDHFGSAEAYAKNIEFEYQRNGERYEFLRWAQNAFENVRIVPPGSGIVHQINLEFLMEVISTGERDGVKEAFPDTCIGTDSHTTMSNGGGVLSWGVGGIEAEAVMLGQPYFMPLPEVIGMRMRGKLPETVTATDLVLAITKQLREYGVVSKIVEFFGEGLASLPVSDRATIGNMSPEFGATATFFPVDERTIDYLRMTGRDEEHIQLVEQYTKANAMWYDLKETPTYTHILEIDCDAIQPSVAGPRRPQDLLKLGDLKYNFIKNFPSVNSNGKTSKAGTPPHGGVAIAAITSCTNTSNPAVMIGAGLLARNAEKQGLTRCEWVKSSLAPGSRVVTAYLENSALLPHLEKFGFYTVGYGCTTCIGNSGPLTEMADNAITNDGKDLVAVLSGNRNFEGRIHPQIKASYLASPMLVVAYAIAGRVDIDFDSEPVAKNADGKEIFLKDIWPTRSEILQTMSDVMKPELFKKHYGKVYEGTEEWRSLKTAEGASYQWNDTSTYIKKPPYFDDFDETPKPINDILGTYVLAKFGDSVTTDHISPAGAIPSASPTGQYLKDLDVKLKQFNSYGSRRGNHEVMMRGTFGNVRLRNQLVKDAEGDWTIYWPDNEKMRIFDAAQKYKTNDSKLIVLAGKEYGSGSSRDWAAKGPQLLGVAAVIAESYERIHRSNLIGMGILPLEYCDEDNADKLGLVGNEKYHIRGLSDEMKPRSFAQVEVVNGTQKKKFKVLIRLDNNTELDYYRHGGILPYVVRQLLAS